MPDPATAAAALWLHPAMAAWFVVIEYKLHISPNL
jgi:hypothetical protein